MKIIVTKRADIPSKLLTSTGFSGKIFFFSIFLVGDSLVKKSTVGIKSGFMKCQNQNFDFALQNPHTKFLFVEDNAPREQEMCHTVNNYCIPMETFPI